jgi:hypothetical protein
VSRNGGDILFHNKNITSLQGIQTEDNIHTSGTTISATTSTAAPTSESEFHEYR